jgi:hypothetical protein
MAIFPFDVNDQNIRRTFFDKFVVECIVQIPEDAHALWGTMTAHNMIEHLIWAFEGSTGVLELPCCTPGQVLERAKRFLYDNRTTPRLFKNPLLGEQPLPHRYQKFSDAKAALLKNIDIFHTYFLEHPGAVHTHPVFGPLGADEWQRSHFKHCYHHLLQFGLLHPGAGNGEPS